MLDPADLRSGKGHRDENFPVASRVIAATHRGLILAFYEFVRTADDIADHPSLAEAEKLALLDRLEATLLGQNGDDRPAVTLRSALEHRGLSPRHAQDLLKAFRLDVTKRRYNTWGEVIEYCSYSAMPVGRFVLDVHKEDRATWPASDALCAALQIINHLQDCRADYRNLDRVYVPLDTLDNAGLGVAAFGEECASPALRRCLQELAARTDALLRDSSPLPRLVADTRLALEISVIQTLAQRLLRLLMRRDPLSQRVHLGKAEIAGLTVLGLSAEVFRRLARAAAARPKSQDA